MDADRNGTGGVILEEVFNGYLAPLESLGEALKTDSPDAANLVVSLVALARLGLGQVAEALHRPCEVRLQRFGEVWVRQECLGCKGCPKV